MKKGHGREITAENTIYEGEWDCNAPHGKGLLITPGFQYEGYFSHGVKEGEGIMI